MAAACKKCGGVTGSDDLYCNLCGAGVGVSEAPVVVEQAPDDLSEETVDA